MSKHRVSPSFDALEARLTLSTLTSFAYRHAKADIRHALGGREKKAEAFLTRAASRIPLATTALLPLWQAQRSAVSAGIPKAIVRREILLSLDLYLHRGVESGALTVRGAASRQVSRPVVRTLDGYARFENLTNLDLTLVLTRDDRVIFKSTIQSGATEHFKPPAPDLLPMSLYKTLVTTSDGKQAGLEARDIENTTFVFLDGPVPGEVEIRAYNSGF